jgi:hypothetical protein
MVIVEYEGFVGLVLVCCCSFISVRQPCVWAVPNWHLRLLAFGQELNLLDVCFHIWYCDRVNI